MAYIHKIEVPSCMQHMCRKRAVSKVFNSENQLVGTFCQNHARQMINTLTRMEEKTCVQREKQPGSR